MAPSVFRVGQPSFADVYKIAEYIFITWQRNSIYFSYHLKPHPASLMPSLVYSLSLEACLLRPFHANATLFYAAGDWRVVACISAPFYG